MAEERSPIESYSQLSSVLSSDRTYYTSQLPREILGLVFNYLIQKAYVFGNNAYGNLGIGNAAVNDQKQPVLLNVNVQDLAFADKHTLLLTDSGELYISGKFNNGYGIDRDEKELLINSHPDAYQKLLYRHGMRGEEFFNKFINISAIKATTLEGQKIVKIATSLYESILLTDKNRGYFIMRDAWVLIRKVREIDEDLEDGILEEDNQEDDLDDEKWAEDIIDIAAGYQHICYLTSDRRCVIKGDNTYGELGVDEDYRYAIAKHKDIQKIFASNINTAYTVFSPEHGANITYIFGDNSLNKLGLPDPSAKSRIFNPSLLLDEFDSPIFNVQKICFGHEHMLILTDQYLYACGSNEYGELGLGELNQVNRPRIYEQFLGQKVTDIEVDGFSSYIVVNKICYATGINSSGQLGLGHNNVVKTFTRLPLFTNSFINNIDMVRVRAGDQSAGLLII
jgi:alpha-tubulin suppressor-like RCC1 family protein